MPWELEGDLGPLEDEEDKDLPIEEVIERMYNIGEQFLDIAAANIKRAQKIQARSCNTKHCRNAFEVGEKVWRKNPQWNTKQKSLKKGPKWYDPYEVAQRKDSGLLFQAKTRAKSPRKSTLQTTSRGLSTETQRFLIVILNMDLTMRTVSQLHKRVV